MIQCADCGSHSFHLVIVDYDTGATQLICFNHGDHLANPPQEM